MPTNFDDKFCGFRTFVVSNDKDVAEELRMLDFNDLGDDNRLGSGDLLRRVLVTDCDELSNPFFVNDPFFVNNSCLCEQYFSSKGFLIDIFQCISDHMFIYLNQSIKL